MPANLPAAPLYEVGGQPQRAQGVFMLDAAPGATSAPPLIDFSTGYVIGLAEGDTTWSSVDLDGYQTRMLVSVSTPVLFLTGELVDPERGPILLTTGLHYFSVLPPTEGNPVVARFRNLAPAPEGYITINWLLDEAPSAP